MISSPIDDDFATVYARLLVGFVEEVSTLGGDPAAFVDGNGMPDTYPAMAALLERASYELDCPHFGLRLATRQGGLAAFGLLGVAMRNCRTFGDALAYVANHSYAHSPATRIEVQARPEEDGVFVSHDVLLDGVAERGQLMEQMLLAGQLAAIEMTGGRARARRVDFRHQPLSPPATYRRYFGCAVRFGRLRDGCLFAQDALAAWVSDPDDAVYDAVNDVIERRFADRTESLAADVRGLVTRYLGTEDCSNARVAAVLGLHSRTLHRRLAAEGTSFREIKHAVRRDLMRFYLGRTDFDFARISARLGFAEQSVLSRSCRRWLAASPTAVRAGSEAVPDRSCGYVEDGRSAS